MNEKEIQRTLEGRITDIEKELKEAHRAVMLFEKGEWFYRINLRSCWADYGEKSITHDGKPGDSLEKVVEDGENEFKKINNRNDVQAFRNAFVVVKNDVTFMIDYPKKKE